MWGWFDQQTENGNAPSVSKKLLDRMVGVIGFCEHMKSVAWMIELDGVISLPHFDRHNGKTAKNRLLTAKRVANHKASNGKSNAANVSGALPKEDVEKNKKPLSARMPIDPRMPSEMTLDWKPDSKILRTYALHQGVALDLFTDHALKAFTGYYEPKGQINTEAEWVSMLVKWVRNDLNRNSKVKPFAPRQACQDLDCDDTGWNEQGVSQ